MYFSNKNLIKLHLYIQGLDRVFKLNGGNPSNSYFEIFVSSIEKEVTSRTILEIDNLKFFRIFRCAQTVDGCKEIIFDVLWWSGIYKRNTAFLFWLCTEILGLYSKKIEVDYALIWEDMISKTGSFISKESFREFLTPYYIKFIDFLKQYGVKNIIVDCDENIISLIPLWIEMEQTVYTQ